MIYTHIYTYFIEHYIKRYQDLKSDYIKFTKAEAVRKKEKAEAEAKAKLESRKF